MDITVQWEKVDSHTADKLKKNPSRKLKGNKLAWRLNEAADELAGNQRLLMAPVEEVFC